MSRGRHTRYISTDVTFETVNMQYITDDRLHMRESVQNHKESLAEKGIHESEVRHNPFNFELDADLHET
jgi:hypothetical protein